MPCQKMKPPMPQSYGMAIFIRRIYLLTLRTQAIFWGLFTGSLSVPVHYICKFGGQRFSITTARFPTIWERLRDVEKAWGHIVGVARDDSAPEMPCSLHFSDEEIQQLEQDGELWAQGVVFMDAFVRDTGCFKHWDGRVSDVDYEKSRRELDEGVKRFLDREARNDEERTEWLKVLPFVNSSVLQG